METTQLKVAHRLMTNIASGDVNGSMDDAMTQSNDSNDHNCNVVIGSKNIIADVINEVSTTAKVSNKQQQTEFGTNIGLHKFPFIYGCNNEIQNSSAHMNFPLRLTIPSLLDLNRETVENPILLKNHMIAGETIFKLSASKICSKSTSSKCQYFPVNQCTNQRKQFPNLEISANQSHAGHKYDFSQKCNDISIDVGNVVKLPSTKKPTSASKYLYFPVTEKRNQRKKFPNFEISSDRNNNKDKYDFSQKHYEVFINASNNTIPGETTCSKVTSSFKYPYFPVMQNNNDYCNGFPFTRNPFPYIKISPNIKDKYGIPKNYNEISIIDGNSETLCSKPSSSFKYPPKFPLTQSNNVYSNCFPSARKQFPYFQICSDKNNVKHKHDFLQKYHEISIVGGNNNIRNNLMTQSANSNKKTFENSHTIQVQHQHKSNNYCVKQQQQQQRQQQSWEQTNDDAKYTTFIRIYEQNIFVDLEQRHCTSSRGENGKQDVPFGQVIINTNNNKNSQIYGIEESLANTTTTTLPLRKDAEHEENTCIPDISNTFDSDTTIITTLDDDLLKLSIHPPSLCSDVRDSSSQEVQILVSADTYEHQQCSLREPSSTSLQPPSLPLSSPAPPSLSTVFALQNNWANFDLLPNYYAREQIEGNECHKEEVDELIDIINNTSATTTTIPNTNSENEVRKYSITVDYSEVKTNELNERQNIQEETIDMKFETKNSKSGVQKNLTSSHLKNDQIINTRSAPGSGNTVRLSSLTHGGGMAPKLGYEQSTVAMQKSLTNLSPNVVGIRNPMIRQDNIGRTPIVEGKVVQNYSQIPDSSGRRPSLTSTQRIGVRGSRRDNNNDGRRTSLTLQPQQNVTRNLLQEPSTRRSLQDNVLRRPSLTQSNYPRLSHLSAPTQDSVSNQLSTSVYNIPSMAKETAIRDHHISSKIAQESVTQKLLPTEETNTRNASSYMANSNDSSSTSIGRTTKTANRALSSDTIESVLPERTRLRRQRRMQSQEASVDQPEDVIERLNRLRARISGALTEVKGVLKQYSTDNENDDQPASKPLIEPTFSKADETPGNEDGPVNFRFIRKLRRRSVFNEEDEDKITINEEKEAARSLLPKDLIEIDEQPELKSKEQFLRKQEAFPGSKTLETTLTKEVSRKEDLLQEPKNQAIIEEKSPLVNDKLHGTAQAKEMLQKNLVPQKSQIDPDDINKSVNKSTKDTTKEKTIKSKRKFTTKSKDERRASIAVVEATKIEPTINLATATTQRRPSDSATITKRKAIIEKSTSGGVEPKNSEKGVNKIRHPPANIEANREKLIAPKSIDGGNDKCTCARVNAGTSVVEAKKEKFKESDKITTSTIVAVASATMKNAQVNVSLAQLPMIDNDRSVSNNLETVDSTVRTIAPEVSMKNEQGATVSPPVRSTTNQTDQTDQVHSSTELNKFVSESVLVAPTTDTRKNILNESAVADEKTQQLATVRNDSQQLISAASLTFGDIVEKRSALEKLNTESATDIKKPIHQNLSAHVLSADVLNNKQAQVQLQVPSSQQVPCSIVVPKIDKTTTTSEEFNAICIDTTTKTSSAPTISISVEETTASATSDATAVVATTTRTAESNMPELQIVPVPVQALQDYVKPDETTAPFHKTKDDVPKHKVIFKKLIRKSSIDKPIVKKISQESSSAENENLQINSAKDIIDDDGIEAKLGVNAAAVELEIPKEIVEDRAGAETITTIEEQQPIPAPKKQRKIKKKVIIKRQPRKLSISDTFFKAPEESANSASASIDDDETLEKAISYVSDDEENNDVAEQVVKPLKTCLKQREFQIGDKVMYAERFKKTQVKWKMGVVMERITSISYKLDVDGKEVPAHISYIKKYTDRKVNFGGKVYLEINYEQIAEEEEKARSYSIWNMV